MHPAALAANPALEAVLSKLAGAIDESEMRGVNAQVDNEGRQVRDVVRDVLMDRCWVADTSSASP